VLVVIRDGFEWTELEYQLPRVCLYEFSQLECAQPYSFTFLKF
jgi:hypothetical protein